MTGGVVRRLVAGTARAVAALAALLAAWLFLFGGFDVRLFGHVVTSHEPMRPLLIAALAVTVFMLAGGDAAVTRRVKAVAAIGERLGADGWTASLPLQRRLGAWLRAGHLDRAAVAALTLVAVVVGLHDGSKAAGGSDSYGYISQVDLFLKGSLKVEQPWVRDVPWPAAIWTFSPLGYKPAQPPQDVGAGPLSSVDRLFRQTLARAGYQPAYDPTAIVPTYSPGLPILMAAAKWIAGNSAMFWVVPLSGVIFILSTFGIGCRLGSPRLGTMAAFLVATSPPVLAFELVTMTDLPVASAWALAIWCLLCDSVVSASVGGLALGAAVLIRPNLVPLLPIVAIWLGLRVIRGAPHRWRHIGRGVILLAGAALGMAWTAAIYWTTYGSPFESGYGPAAGYFSLDYALPNLRNYTQWFTENQTPVVYLGIAALCLPMKWLWPRGTDRSAVIMSALFVAAVWVEFCFYLVGDNPGYLRFLLPTYPFVMLGLSSVGLRIAGLRWRGAAPAVVAATIALGLLGVDFASRANVFRQWQEDISIEIGADVRRFTPENSVVMAMQHSGAIRYYGGRVTLRWDGVPADWLDRSVAWLAERGVPTYVLVDGWERDLMRTRFAGQTLAARLDDPPVFRLGDKALFNLSAPPGAMLKTEEIPLVLQKGRIVPPAPLPAPMWKK
jgi:hypothetical protein